MPHQKTQNSFPPGIFDDHFKNAKEAQDEIQADIEAEKENQKTSSTPTSLSAAVSKGKEKMTDFFTKRVPLGRGGGGMSEKRQSALTGKTTAAAMQPKSNSGTATPEPSFEATLKVSRTTLLTNGKASKVMSSSNTTNGIAMTTQPMTNSIEVNNTTSNHKSHNNNAFVSPGLGNNIHGTGSLVSVNKGIFSSASNNINGKHSDDDITMTGNKLTTSNSGHQGSNHYDIGKETSNSRSGHGPNSQVSYNDYTIGNSNQGTNSHPGTNSINATTSTTTTSSNNGIDSEMATGTSIPTTRQM